MGGSFCCYNRFNILSQARNEQELSESINTLKNDIDYGLLYDLNKYSIKRSKNSNIDIKKNITKLHSNFYRINLLNYLNKFEKRFLKQRFSKFHFVRESFALYFKEVTSDYDFNNLITKSETINDLLDITEMS